MQDRPIGKYLALWIHAATTDEARAQAATGGYRKMVEGHLLQSPGARQGRRCGHLPGAGQGGRPPGSRLGAARQDTGAEHAGAMGQAIDDFAHFAARRDGLSHYGRIPERRALQRIPHGPDRRREPEILLVEDSPRVHHATLVRGVAGRQGGQDSARVLATVCTKVQSRRIPEPAFQNRVTHGTGQHPQKGLAGKGHRIQAIRGSRHPRRSGCISAILPPLMRHRAFKGRVNRLAGAR